MTKATSKPSGKTPGKPATKTQSIKKAILTPTAAKTKAVTDKPAETPAWNTIHVFGYGETQLIGQDLNGKIPNEALKTLTPFIEHLSTKQQKGNSIKESTIHAINIFNGHFVGFMPKPGKNEPQRFSWADLDKKLLKKFTDEIVKKIQTKPSVKKLTQMMGSVDAE